MPTTARPFEKQQEDRFNRYAVALPLVFIGIITVFQFITRADFTGPLRNTWPLVFLLYGLAAGAAFLKPKNSKWRTYDYISVTLMHLALAFEILFVAKHQSIYLFAWPFVYFDALKRLSSKRYNLFSIILFLLVIAVSPITHRVAYTTEILITSIASFTLATLLSLIINSAWSLNTVEQKALTKSYRQNKVERQRLLALINNMGEAVLATDEKGKIILYNAAVLNLLDTNATLEGKSIDSVLNLHELETNHSAKMTTLIKKSPSGITTTNYIHKFGPNDLMNVYINIAPIKLGFKEKLQSGYIIIMRDITKEKSLEEERDEFISVVSHELRTPVAIAEGNISNAQFVTEKHHDPKAVTNALEQAHEQVVFLARMINDLATLSRAERSDVEMELNTIDITRFVEDLGLSYQQDTQTKGLTLTTSVAKNTKSLITSELYLHEILQNFITNAIKYTRKGTILVHARSDQLGNAIFSVADTGIGLNKADQKRVFDKFFRSEDYRTRESSGTGLGLYVTAKLAKRIGATITLESELNKGTTFTITVPQQKK